MDRSITDADIEAAYIDRMLRKHSIWLNKLWLSAMRRRRMRRTGQLQTSIASNQHSLRSDGKGQATLSRNFVGYGRAAEINYYRRRRSSTGFGISRAAARELVWGQSERRARIKDTRWYTRVMYGAQNRLASHIMYGFSEAKRKLLREHLTRMFEHGPTRSTGDSYRLSVHDMINLNAAIKEL